MAMKQVKIIVYDYTNGSLVIKERRGVIDNVKISGATTDVIGLRVIGPNRTLSDGIPLPKTRYESGILQKSTFYGLRTKIIPCYNLYTFKEGEYCFADIVTDEQKQLIGKNFIPSNDRAWQNQSVNRMMQSHSNKSNWEKIAPTLMIFMIIGFSLMTLVLTWQNVGELALKIQNFVPTCNCILPEVLPAAPIA